MDVSGSQMNAHNSLILGLVLNVKSMIFLAFLKIIIELFRYDSEASLTSIDSVMSMIHLSMGSSYISPPKVEPNSPPVSGLRSVRGLFKKKTSRRSAFASVGETEFDLATPDA